MLNQGNLIREYILENVANNPTTIVKKAVAIFSVTPMTVNRHINTLIEKGLLTKTGQTRSTKYFLQSENEKIATYTITSGIAEHKIFEEFACIFKRLPKNVYDICDYGVTEMLNNSIDHSKGSTVTLETKFSDPNIIITIKDNGVGVFKTIYDYLQIPDIREAILHLSKGKVTRDPNNHTGQGIFFTSRMFDKFIIESNGYEYTKNNLIQDWTFMKSNISEGSVVTLVINTQSSTINKEIFSKYEGDNWSFDKTEVLVKLANYEKSSLISRSQAKRVLLGLDKFLTVTLDFKNVSSVGQGFVDEIFRVFASKNNKIEIRYINANTNIEFMIERSFKTDGS